jgi:hypothetical protein
MQKTSVTSPSLCYGGARPVYHGASDATWYPQNSGYLGEALFEDSLQNMRVCLRPAKTQRKGLLTADDGCTVRWTPDRDYDFVPTINHNVVVPLLPYHPCGFPASAALKRSDPAPPSTTAVPVVRLIDGTSLANDAFNNHTNDAGDIAAYYSSLGTATTGSFSPGKWNQADAVNGRVPTELGTIRKHISGNNGATNGDGFVHSSYVFYASDGDMYENSYIDIGDTKAMAYMDEAQNFVHGLYIDMTGLAPGQFVDVQVVWHIEYVPKETSLNAGIPSPVDLNWPMIEAMVSNPEAFPIVVKGHSFFSSLFHGIKAAGSAIGGILKGASSVASLIPDPRAQAFGAGAGAIGGALGSVFH